jgi:hypothetical protein
MLSKFGLRSLFARPVENNPNLTKHPDRDPISKASEWEETPVMLILVAHKS